MAGRRLVVCVVAVAVALVGVGDASAPAATGAPAGGSPSVSAFPDVPDGAWFGPAVSWAVRHGTMEGYPDGRFRPGSWVTRGQVAAWLWRQAGSPPADGPAPFPDARWASTAAAWADAEGVMTGYRDGRFRPGRPASRTEIVVWLWRRAGRPRPAGAVPYRDVRPGAWHADAVTWAAEEGLVGGYRDGTFRGDRPARRREVVWWLWGEAGRPDGTEPNLVVVFTDDQSLESMRWLPRTRALVGDQGTTFRQAVANFPLCCPARATLLNGRYAHNHGVLDNRPPGGGFPALDGTATLPVWLDDAGYVSAHVGKYLNGYAAGPGSQVVPPGWDRWFGLTDGLPRPLGYYGYAALVDDDTLAVGDQVAAAEVVTFGDADADYLTDVLADRSVHDLRALHASGRPFYLQVSTLAPHTGPGRAGHEGNAIVPAPRHEGALADVEPPFGPAYAEADRSDKPQWVRDLGDAVWSPDIDELVRQVYREYAESLLAVDDLVGDVVAELGRLDVLDRTVVVFTSDNGWSFGENHLAFLKNHPYETATRVPLLVRGPGFPAGAVRDQPVGHVDVVPTLLAAAGVAPPLALDGEALQAFAADAAHRADRALLVANGPAAGPVHHFEGVRTAGEWFVRHGPGGSEGVEYHDLVADPHQLQSRHADPSTAAARARLAALLDRLVGCSGASCQVP